MIRHDLRDKIINGICSGVGLLVLTVGLRFLTGLSKVIFGSPGVLALTFGILAATILCLDRSLVFHLSDTARAWYGMVGGVLAWMLVILNNSLEGDLYFNQSFILALIMTSLVVSVLWRRILPLGGKFFAMTFLLGWGNSLLLLVKQQFEISYLWSIQIVWVIVGYLAILGVIVVVGWLLTFSERRLQRLWGGVVLWILGSLAFEVLWGVAVLEGRL